MGSVRRRASMLGCTLVAILLSILANHGHAAESDLSSVRIIIEGMENNMSVFGASTFEFQFNETRYCKDEEGNGLTVGGPLGTFKYTAKGPQLWFSYEGGVFVRGQRAFEAAQREGAFNTAEFVLLDHTYKLMRIEAESRPEQWGAIDPRACFGNDLLRDLKATHENASTSIEIVGEESVHGTKCLFLRFRAFTHGDLIETWIDQEHGFIPRRTRSWSAADDSKKLVFEQEIASVLEVSPGVWAPREVSMRGYPVRHENFNFSRKMLITSVDVESEIPDALFHLERPNGYYVDDYVSNLHYDPDVMKGETAGSLGEAAENLVEPSGVAGERPTVEQGNEERTLTSGEGDRPRRSFLFWLLCAGVAVTVFACLFLLRKPRQMES